MLKNDEAHINRRQVASNQSNGTNFSMAMKTMQYATTAPMHSSSFPPSSPLNRQHLINAALRHARRRFVRELTNDLVDSAWVTLTTYFSLFLLVYACLEGNFIHDPCQSIECSRGQTQPNEAALVALAQTVESILTRLGLHRTSFICYSTLFELLRFGHRLPDSQRLDLCVYDPLLEPTGLVRPLLYVLGMSKLERELSRVGVHYTYNRLLGYYHLTHQQASIYLYMFTHAPRDKYSFESIRRAGPLYLQFERVLALFALPDAAALTTYSAQSTPPLPPRQLSLFNKFQTYVIDEMFIRVNVGGASSSHECFFLLPIDPFDMIAHFYPRFWHATPSLNCSTITQ